MILVVDGQRIYNYEYQEPQPIATNSLGFIDIEFRMSEEWEGYICTAQFVQHKENGTDFIASKVLYNNHVTFPDGIVPGVLEISLFGYKAGEAERGTTFPYIQPVCRSGFTSTEATPIPPTPDLYSQFLESFETTKQSIESDKQIVQNASKDAITARDYAVKAAESAKSYEQNAIKTLEAIKEASSGLIEDIETAGATQISNVQSEGATQISSVKDAGNEQSTALSAQGDVEQRKVIAAGDEQVSRVTNAGNDAVESVTLEKTNAVNSVQSTKTDAVNSVESAKTSAVEAVKSAESAAIQNIGTGVDDTLSISGKAADAKKTGDSISSLKDDLDDLEKVINFKNLGDDATYSNGKYSVGETEPNTNSAYFHTSKLELKKGDSIVFSSDYVYQLVLFNASGFVVTTNTVTETYVATENTTVSIQGYTQPIVVITDEVLTQIKSKTKIKMYRVDGNTEAIEIANSAIKKIEEMGKGTYKQSTDHHYSFSSGKQNTGDSTPSASSNWFISEKLSKEDGLTISVSDIARYGKLQIITFNTAGIANAYANITSVPFVYERTEETFVIQGWRNPAETLDNSKLAEISNDIVITYNSAVSTEYLAKSGIANLEYQKPNATNNNVHVAPTNREVDFYPLYPLWGHEYLGHWYEKIFNNASCKIVLDGDSITEGYNAQEGYADAFVNMKGEAIRRMMVVGGYSEDNFQIINNGVGGCSTFDYVGNPLYPKNQSIITQYPNGLLDKSMSDNPDLLIVAFGMNDAKPGDSEGLTIQQKLDYFEANYTEALKRIRGNESVNGRPAYNKSVDDLSIILNTPTCTTVDYETTALGYNAYDEHCYKNWHQLIREIMISLCRKYNCAFADLTARTYGQTDEKFVSWSVYNSNGTNYRFHPNKYALMQANALMQELIMPTTFWK